MEKRPFAVLQAMLAAVPVGERYRHYKSGNVYLVVGGAIAEATQEPLVVYQPAGEGRVSFARPLAEWDELVEHEGKTVRRFSKV